MILRWKKNKNFKKHLLHMDNNKHVSTTSSNTAWRHHGHLWRMKRSWWYGWIMWSVKRNNKIVLHRQWSDPYSFIYLPLIFASFHLKLRQLHLPSTTVVADGPDNALLLARSWRHSSTSFSGLSRNELSTWWSRAFFSVSNF